MMPPFTYIEYRDLIRLAKRYYTFVFFDDYETLPIPHIFWRHDIDVSIHRAFRLAELENEENICSTFFVHLHSPFYHFSEKEVTEKITQISGMGHRIGLHFDSHYYGALDENQFGEKLKYEAKMLEQIIGQKITVFSFHDPDDDILQNNQDIAGMVNTYNHYFRNQVDYVSDSNGIWRFRSLREVLERGEHPKLQVLTHPVWWTDSVETPKQKILDCIYGRAQSVEEWYLNRARLVVEELPNESK